MSNFAVGGLASGLDTKSIISQLIAIDSRPKQLMEWKAQLGTIRKNAWSDLQGRLSALRSSTDALMKFDAWTVPPAAPPTGPFSATSTNSAVATAAVTGSPVAGNYAVNVTQLARGEVDLSSGAGGVPAGGDTLSIVGAGGSWNIALAAGDLKQDIVNKINATAGIGVVAAMVGTDIQLQSASTGGASAFTVSSAGTTAAALGFARTQSAQDALYTVDGGARTSATNSNITGGIAGLTLSLASLGSTTLAVTQASTGPSPQDVWIDATVAKVKEFAKNYNSTLGQVYAKTQGETRVANPKNLGDYLQGPMSRDYEYSQYGFNLRGTVSDDVVGLPAGQGNLASIGIKALFDTKSPATNGNLEVDEAALRAALKADPAHVKAVLTQAGTNPSTTSDDGFARRISAFALNSDILLSKKTVSLGQDAATLQKSIEQQTDRLAGRQKYYERMYSRMEASLGKLQSQGSWLSGQLAGLSGGKG